MRMEDAVDLFQFMKELLVKGTSHGGFPLDNMNKCIVKTRSQIVRLLMKAIGISKGEQKAPSNQHLEELLESDNLEIL